MTQGQKSLDIPPLLRYNASIICKAVNRRSKRRAGLKEKMGATG